MWVNKTIGAIKDFEIKKGDILTGTITFTQNGAPYSLNDITPSLRIYKPGVATPVLTLTNGNGFTKSGNSIAFNKLISLPTMMYKYELFFDYATGTDAVVMSGAFFVRKTNVTSISSAQLTVTQQNINIAVAVTIEQVTQLDVSHITIDGGLIF